VAEGVLADLARWPVKSLGGEPAGAARLDWRGAGRRPRPRPARPARGSRGPLAHRPPGAAAAGLVGRLPGRARRPPRPRDPPPPDPAGPGRTRLGLGRPGLEGPGGRPRPGRAAPPRPGRPAGPPGVGPGHHRGVAAGGRRRPRPPGRAAAFPDQPAPGAGRARVRRGGWDGGPAPGRRGHPGPRPPLRPLRDPDPRPRRPVRWPELLRWLHRRRGALFGVNARVVAGGPGPGRRPGHRDRAATTWTPRPSTDGTWPREA
jgi:hypothetical protein